MNARKAVNLSIFCLFVCISSSISSANDKIEQPNAPRSLKVLSHKQWRELQINEGQNLLIRLTNRIARVKESTGNLELIRRLESEQRVAAQNLELLKGLTVEDYLNFYLSQLNDDRATFVAAAKKMNKREVAILLKVLVDKMREGVVSLEPSVALENLAIQQQRLVRPISQGL